MSKCDTSKSWANYVECWKLKAAVTGLERKRRCMMKVNERKKSKVKFFWMWSLMNCGVGWLTTKSIILPKLLHICVSDPPILGGGIKYNCIHARKGCKDCKAWDGSGKVQIYGNRDPPASILQLQHTLAMHGTTNYVQISVIILKLK